VKLIKILERSLLSCKRVVRVVNLINYDELDVNVLIVTQE